MGIAIYLVFQSVVGIACLVGIAVGGSFLLRKIARPEALDTSLALVWILMCAVVVAAFAWGSQLETGSGPTLAGWEQRYCGEDAGESIYRSVENINGVFYLAPALGARHGHFHTDDGRAEKFLRRPDRRYDFLEVRMAADRLVERHELKDGKIASTRTDVPTARYAFTWTPLESMEEANAGIYGEELEVFDRETREVLGRRVLYYRDPSRRGTAAYGSPMPVCPQGILATDPTYIDGQPRDSYEFVSRVLKPVALTAGENEKFFDLRRGGGRRSKQCVGGYVWIGEGIEPKDLSFARQGKDLTITISDGSGDELLCRDYFFSETGGSRSYRLRFAGRALISEEELRLRLASKDAAK